jgi:predicted dehydrogenase
MEHVRWGIVGTGGIAAAMADTLLHMTGAVATSVTSRSPDRAQRFAAAHGIPHVFPSTASLAASGEVDVVYVASNNHLHAPDVLACLAAGIPVLCEKPFALDAAEAEGMVAEARRRGVFLMEAMWMRFQPAWERLTRLLDSGVVGPLRYVSADFGFPADPDPTRRWFDPEQGGGALLDVGVYPVTFACLLAGEPQDVVAVEVPAGTGVDGQVGMVMRHPDGVLSVLGCSFFADTALEAVVAGPTGRIHLDAPFHHTARLTRRVRQEVVGEEDVGYAGSGYRFEVEEVHRCLREGRTESRVHPLDDTLMVMRTLDRVRASAAGG